MNLSFRLGKIPVRILPSFFITTVFLNVSLARSDLRELLLWLVIVLASVLVHEMGHALAGLAFGLSPQVDLHGFGGTTSWATATALTPGRRIVISLAGPTMGFLAGLLVLAVWRLGKVPASPIGDFVFSSLLFVNIGWGVLNLLPMLPLDGGNVMRHALDIFTRGHGDRPARVASLAVAALATVAALVTQSWWPALLAGSFLLSNWRELKELKLREEEAPMRLSLEEAYVALAAKDAERVLSLARPVALKAHTPPVRAEALQLLAFGFLLEGRLADADAALAALPKGFAPHPSLLELHASVAGAAGVVHAPAAKPAETPAKAPAESPAKTVE